ncbi:MAG TPA: type I-E CRISPR-associated endonuclease Cas1e [Dermatophilaceae bacterium]|nr:type I-E CRISPR-associated endonuclease Cas1e [Dermatophilaceae bacterium]
MPPAELDQLVRVEDRLSFVYVERCIVHREDNAVTFSDDRGTVHLPAATLSALLLGPGTRVSQAAIALLADSGSTIVWVGESGVRYYAHGQGLASSSRLLIRQAALVSNQTSRLRVAREMYAMRFPGEDVSALTMQQLRGREGARVRKAYRAAADAYGVDWRRRDYDSDDFAAGDPVNQALSAATAGLYGLVHAIIVALGCSPGLGFVHTGNTRSFVFDIADLYRVDLAIPTAFSVAARAAEVEDIGAETRRSMRDVLFGGQLASRCAGDIRRLLADPTAPLPSGADDARILLWDGANREVEGGRAWREGSGPEVDPGW